MGPAGIGAKQQSWPSSSLSRLELADVFFLAHVATHGTSPYLDSRL